jgi:arabinose-5-phosphate isomerase
MKKINYISIAKKAAAIQISELKKVNKMFDKSFEKAVELMANCKGKVIAAGIGKSGHILRKVSATLSSVGISSFFLNPSEGNHGDLGQITKNDVLLVLSYSGNTAEISNMLKYANRFNIKVIGIASKKDSMLLKASDIKILLPQVKEADPTGMVPTTSTSISLLFGDSLAVALMNKMNFSKDRFKVFHPGGNIGQTLLMVKDIMITGKKLPLISISKNIYAATKVIADKKLGLVVITQNKHVRGILTDGDARRGIRYYSKDDHLEKFMTANPLFISETAPASKALALMNEKKITSLLVASEKDYNIKSKHKKLKGIVHIHSLLQYGIK